MARRSRRERGPPGAEAGGPAASVRRDVGSPLAAGRADGAPVPPAARWDRLLVWFMRLVALAWLAKGVVAWAQIVGALPDAPAFDTAPVGRQTAIVYFGVIDCIAAVGLWLAGAWGGVVWLFAATSALILGVFAPDLAPLPTPVAAFCAATIAVYFVLSWLASAETR